MLKNTLLESRWIRPTFNNTILNLEFLKEVALKRLKNLRRKRNVSLLDFDYYKAKSTKIMEFLTFIDEKFILIGDT